jgi:hypothetical protein
MCLASCQATFVARHVRGNTRDSLTPLNQELIRWYRSFVHLAKDGADSPSDSDVAMRPYPLDPDRASEMKQVRPKDSGFPAC